MRRKEHTETIDARIEALMADGQERTPRDISEAIGVKYPTTMTYLHKLTKFGVLVMRYRNIRILGTTMTSRENIYRLASTLDCSVEEWRDEADDEQIIRGQVDVVSIRQSAINARTPLECAWMGQL